MKTILKKRTLFFLLALTFSCLQGYAQEDSKHYLPPTFHTDLPQKFVHVVLTTNETTPFSVTYTNCDGSFSGTVSGLSKNTPQKIILSIGTNNDGMVCITENKTNQILRTEGLTLSSASGKLFFVNEMFEVTGQGDIVSSKGATAGLGTDFYSGHLSSAYSTGTYFRAHFISVMAPEDNTIVTFDNPRVKWQGQPTNTFSISLNKGESYIVAAPFSYITDNEYNKPNPTAFSDYNGTHITTNGKKIAVNCGSFCSSGVEIDYSFDAGVDQTVPVEYTGKEYIVVEGNGVDNNGNGTPENEIVTIVGTANNTIVSVNGTVFATIQKGGYCIIPESYYHAPSQDKIMYIKTTNNVYAYQTLSANTDNYTSAMVFVPRLTDNAAKAVTISGADVLGALSLYIITKTGSQVEINGNIVTRTPTTITGKPDWVAYRILTDELNTYCASGNNCADKGSNSTFYIQSTNAMNAAVSVMDGTTGAAAYYSGFGMPNAKAGIWKLGLTEYTLACNSAVELLASGATKYTWSGTPAAMALIVPKPSTNDSIQIFTPQSSAGQGPFVYKVDMEVTNPLTSAKETQTAILTVYVKPIEDNIKPDPIEVCLGKSIGLNGTATPIATKTTLVAAVNMGGPGYVDSNGFSYSSGSKYRSGGQNVSIANTTDQTLYQTETYNNGSMNFNFTVPNGIYTVKLMWAETWFSSTGQRKFNVDVENNQILEKDLDIFAKAGGKARAYNIEQNISVSDGVLNVDLTKGSADSPMINAILITKQLAEVPNNGFYTWSPGTNLNYTTVESPLFTPTSLGASSYHLLYNDGHCIVNVDVKVNVTDCTSPCDVTAKINNAATVDVIKGTDVNLTSTSAFSFLEWRKIVGPTESVVTTTNKNSTVRADEAATYRVSYIKPDNLVVNGDFEQGANVGFTVDSSYELIAANSTTAHHDQWSVGNGVEWARPGSIFTNPTAIIPNPDNVGGKILYMDGGWVPGVGIYQTTVPVVAGAKYVFSAYVANIYGGFKLGAVPPELKFQIDGTNLDYITGLTIAKQQWVKFYTTWTATATGNISIKLLNNNTSVDGNDFAIDNICFSPICTNDVTVTVRPPTFTVDAGADTDICDGQAFTRKATVTPAAQGEFIGWYTVGANSTETLLATQTETLGTTPTSTTTYRVKYNNVTPILNENFNGADPNSACQKVAVPPSSNFNNAGNAVQDGVYILTSNPNPGPGLGVDWAAIMNDHTGSGGKMMFVNGGSLNSTNVYKATVSVVAGHDYILSAWAATPVPDTDVNPRADLVFKINNSALGGIDLGGKALRTWFEFKSGLYRATTTGPIDILITNNQTVPTGNDFALDDITFAEIITDDVTVNVNPKPGVDIGSDRSICEGESIGVENISQVDTYKCYKDGTKVSDDFKIKVSSGGTYKLVAVSSKNCSDSASIIVTQVAKPIFTAIDSSACYGSKILLTSSAPSTKDFSYQWFSKDDVYLQTPLVTTSSYDAPTNGDYILKVSVKDVTSGLTCSSVDTATASYKLRPALVFNYAKNALCLHDAAMAIKLSDSYNLVGTLISNPANKGIKETSSGNYLFTQMNAAVGDNKLKFTWSNDGCDMDTTITITVHDVAPPFVYANATLTSVTTLSDTIDVKPYNYFHGVGRNYEHTIHWLDSIGAVIPPLDQLGESNLSGDTAVIVNSYQKYGVFQTDVINGCKSDTVPLTYKFTVCDGSLAGSATFKLLCYGDTATVTLAGKDGNHNYSYSFNGGAFVADSVFKIVPKAAAYSWAIKDKYGCIFNNGAPLTITQPTQIQATLSQTSNTKCSDTSNGTATVNASGGTGATYGYSWNTTPTAQTTATATQLAAATYTVVVTDTKSCTRSFSVAVTDNLSLPNVTASVSTPISCNGGSGEVTLAVSNNTSTSYDYSLASNTKAVQSSQSSIFTGVKTGMGYTWRVKDSYNCEASGTIDVIEPTKIQGLVSSTDNTLCSGTPNGTASIGASGGTGPTYSYSWSTIPTAQKTATATQLAAGKYTVEVTDTKSCMQSFDITVTDKSNKPIVTPSISTPISCHGGSGEITLTIDNYKSISYDFTLASNTKTGVSSQYSIFTGIKSGNGYAWKVKDAYNCEASGTVDMSEPAQIQATLTQTPNTKCSGTPNGTATIVVSGGTIPYNYSWNTTPIAQTSPKASELPAGEYTVSVRDINNCSNNYNITIDQELVYPEAIIANPDIITCGSASVLLNGSKSSTGPNITYSWSGPTLTGNKNSATLEATSPGDYTLVVADIQTNCTSDNNVTVAQSTTLPVVNAGQDQEICIYGSGTNLNAQVVSPYLITNYLWTPNDIISGSNTLDVVVNPSQSTSYTLSVTDENGCFGVDTVLVTVKSFEICYNIVVPKYFTPNEDGVNDKWVIEGLYQFPESKIKIYDRYGKSVHFYIESEEQWDGTSYGLPLTSDDYWYVIEIVPVGKVMTGHVLIKR